MMKVTVETIEWKKIFEDEKYILRKPYVTPSIERDDFKSNEEAWDFFNGFFDIDEPVSFEETDDYISLFNYDGNTSEIRIKMFKPLSYAG